MDEFAAHACYNDDYYKAICASFPSDYADWKIIALFYISIHYLKSLATYRKKQIGHTHKEINANIKQHGTMPIADTARKNYLYLFNYSQTARYDGISDLEVFKAMRLADYAHAQKCFEDFKKFILGNGVKLWEDPKP